VFCFSIKENRCKGLSANLLGNHNFKERGQTVAFKQLFRRAAKDPQQTLG